MASGFRWRRLLLLAGAIAVVEAAPSGGTLQTNGFTAEHVPLYQLPLATPYFGQQPKLYINVLFDSRKPTKLLAVLHHSNI